MYITTVFPLAPTVPNTWRLRVPGERGQRVPPVRPLLPGISAFRARARRTPHASPRARGDTDAREREGTCEIPDARRGAHRSAVSLTCGSARPASSDAAACMGVRACVSLPCVQSQVAGTPRRCRSRKVRLAQRKTCVGFRTARRVCVYVHVQYVYVCMCIYVYTDAERKTCAGCAQCACTSAQRYVGSCEWVC